MAQEQPQLEFELSLQEMYVNHSVALSDFRKVVLKNASGLDSLVLSHMGTSQKNFRVMRKALDIYVRPLLELKGLVKEEEIGGYVDESMALMCNRAQTVLVGISARKIFLDFYAFSAGSLNKAFDLLPEEVQTLIPESSRNQIKYAHPNANFSDVFCAALNTIL
jgi:hypothetical protein